MQGIYILFVIIRILFDLFEIIWCLFDVYLDIVIDAEMFDQFKYKIFTLFYVTCEHQYLLDVHM